MLRHEFPGGEWHYDWLLEGAPGDRPDERALIAFRLTVRPESAPDFDAERLLDHRRRYLSYEGPIASVGGEVRRIAAGECELLLANPDRLEVSLPDGITLSGLHAGAGRWRFRRISSRSREQTERVDTD